MPVKYHSAKKRLAKNIFSLSIVQLANNVLPLITIPFLVRVIGAEKFGAINFMAAIIMYFTLFIQYSFDLTATRKVATKELSDGERSRVFSEVFYTKLLLLGFSTVVFTILICFVPQFSSERLLAIYSFLYCLSLVITPNWLFQGMQDLYKIALCNLISKLLFVIFLLLCIKKQDDYILYPLIYSSATILVGIVTFVFSIKKYKIKIQKVTLIDIFKILIKEKTLFLPIILVNIYTSANLIIIGFLETNYEVAIYSAGWKLIVVIQTLLLMPMSLSLFPYIGESFNKDRLQGIEKIKQIVPLVFLITAFAGVVIFLTAPYIIKTFYGVEFLGSILIMKILCFIPLFSSLNNLLGMQAMVNLNLDKLYLKSTFVSAIVGIVLSLILTVQLGIAGTAYSWILTELITGAFLWVALKNRKINLFDLNFFNYTHVLRICLPMFYVLKRKFSK
ncbi:MAG: hypothetical protein EOO43_04015 [Flavobacterium sp.]|nr:MAG: hypothetical protein EOO43_04015 [Flavobacterium sp.]